MIRRHPFGCFVGLAYALTWLPQAMSFVLAQRLDIELSNEDNFRHFRDLFGAQPNILAQTAYGILPWAIAVFLSKRHGDENLAAVPRLRWWPGRFEVEQRAEV
ncbi:MAG TPA: hypothetical protein VHJ78_05375 [Actinomycetota bacterium]|nr:hypothetical protein [Actinomycetota bacterium]